MYFYNGKSTQCWFKTSTPFFTVYYHWPEYVFVNYATRLAETNMKWKKVQSPVNHDLISSAIRPQILIWSLIWDINKLQTCSLSLCLAHRCRRTPDLLFLKEWGLITIMSCPLFFICVYSWATRSRQTWPTLNRGYALESDEDIKREGHRCI